MLNITNHQGNANQNHSFPLVRKAIIKKTRNNKCWQECGEKGMFVPCRWKYKLVQPLWKTEWCPLKKLKIELPYKSKHIQRFWVVAVQSLSRVWLSIPDCRTMGFPVLHHLLEFAQTHVHWVGDAIQPSHSLSFLSPQAFNISQHQGLFQWVSSLY